MDNAGRAESRRRLEGLGRGARRPVTEKGKRSKLMADRTSRRGERTEEQSGERAEKKTVA